MTASPGPLSRLLVLNAGSSSLKFKVFAQSGGLGGLVGGLGGVVERIGDPANSKLIAKGPDSKGEARKWQIKTGAADHVSAMESILGFLKEQVSSSIKSEVTAVGHRVVHGLDISQPVMLTPPVVDKIKAAAVLAPLHNPPALQGITAAQEVFGPNTPQVGVFDTAYHQTMPPHAFMYGLPYDLYERHHIRRYGFHGTSHQHLAGQAARMLGVPLQSLNAVCCHLGNGSSVTAIQWGRSVDTSMGLTPLEGLMMGTRSGDIDPAIVIHLQSQLKLSPKEVDTLLNKKSGLLGISGVNDVRAVIEKAQQGDKKGALALDMFVYRVRKYIGSYMAALGGDVSALIFSAGIGENSSIVRDLITAPLKGLGAEIDPARNNAMVGGKAGDISAPHSKVRVLVIPTDEELSIAQQTLEVVQRGSGTQAAAPAA